MRRRWTLMTATAVLAAAPLAVAGGMYTDLTVK